MTQSQPEGDADLRRRIDEAVLRLAAIRRTFTEEEALGEVWEAGYNVSPRSDSRFKLGRESDGRNPRHWHLTGQVIATNRLIESLETGTWDGFDLDAELARLDRENGSFHVFCPADERLIVYRDGRVDLADDERDHTLAEVVRATLDEHADRLLARWQAGGPIPWTARQVTEVLGELGWEGARTRAAWLLVRAWLCSCTAVVRVGRDYWVPGEAIPSGPARTRLSVIRIRGGEAYSPNSALHGEAASAPTGVGENPAATIPAEFTSNPPGATTRWTATLRTVNLLEGFLTVPAEARSAYPVAPQDGGRWEVLPARWFETGEQLWVWLDRERHFLCGPDLADRLCWREAGERFELTWSPECLVFRPSGLDSEVLREETRLADAEEIARLRGGLGETYRRSIATILVEHPAGLTFLEIVTLVRERQGHVAGRGTLRAILHAAGFVCQDGRWRLHQSDKLSKRTLRETVVRAAGDHTSIESRLPSVRSRLVEIATSVTDRCRALQNEIRGTDTNEKYRIQN